MNDQEINIAIAEACGWRFKPSREHQCQWVDSTGDRMLLPAYTTDLNAMHEAEKVLNEKQRGEYLRELFKLDGGWAWRELYYSEAFVFVTATARQRAEAFLRTLGKWKD